MYFTFPAFGRHATVLPEGANCSAIHLRGGERETGAFFLLAGHYTNKRSPGVLSFCTPAKYPTNKSPSAYSPFAVGCRGQANRG